MPESDVADRETSEQPAEDTTASAEPAPSSTFRTLAELLWFPLVFFCGFLVCYLLPFHNPSPHDVGVAVAPAPTATQLDRTLGQASPGAFDVQTADSPAAARQAVLDRDAQAAYAVVDGTPTLYVAKADGYMLESVLTKTFTPLAQQSGGALTTVDLAPTASGDAMGTGMFYLVLIWTLPSYIVVMMLLRAVTLSRRLKVGILVGWGAFLSVAGFYGALAMGVVPNDPVAIPIAFLLTQGVALTSFGLVPIAKQFFPGVAMTIFVFLSMPSSGGAVPIQMVPGFFRALHPYMPMGNLLEALRGVFYFDGVGVLRPILVLACWVALGILLIAGNVVWERRKARRQAGDGTAEPSAVAEPPVEDPAFEMPRPTALPVHAHRFGEPEPVVTGFVHDDTERPVAGAAVTVTDSKGKQVVRTTSDGQGRYALAGLPDGSLDLVVSAPGLHSTARRVLLREAHPMRQDFALGRRESVSSPR